MDQDHIRNFAIIAHIDHGKSTLADRLLELTGTVKKREMQEQILDSNPIERERGITIKLAPVRMEYRVQNSKFRIQNGKQSGEMPSSILNSEFYILNLIDTPGHVDFAYEVSRSLAACEGAILVVDATQGVQAQTLANLRQAQEHSLKIIPVINKIDLPNARIEESVEELVSLGFNKEEILQISAKTGENVENVLLAIVAKVPPPSGESTKPLRALVFSSQYDSHKGVVVFVRVVDGILQGHPLQTLLQGAVFNPIELGYFSPKMTPSDILRTGEVGYIATGLKDARLAKVGETITIQNSELRIKNQKKHSEFSIHNSPFVEPLPGYREPKPMVFLGLYPINMSDISLAREAMEKLRLSDSAFTFRPISSLALGNGFHCGFLGLLHAEIVQERLSREFGLNMIATSPSVEYHVRLRGGEEDAGRHAFLERFMRSEQNAGPAGRFPPRIPDMRGPLLGGPPTPVTRENQRLEEASKNVMPTSASSKQVIAIQSAAEFPDPSLIEETAEPVMQVKVYTPRRYVGAVMQLAQEKRGEYIDLKYFGISESGPLRQGFEGQAEFTYLIPLSEMIIDFFDRLKSVTEGYASLDYEFFDYQTVDVVKVDILVNKEKVDALSFLVVRDQAHSRSIAITDRLARVIPRAQFEIPIQAAIGGKVVARSDVKAFRKDVIQKLYGGDRTRKDKLLEAQKKGKAKMKLVGRVEIPQSAFFEVLKRT